VAIILGCNLGTVRLTVADDGNGFTAPPTPHQQVSGWGMTIMRERAELAGGKFTIDSLPGQGTSVTVEIPLEGL
jgi:signal transduction histidine kinase